LGSERCDGRIRRVFANSHATLTIQFISLALPDSRTKVWTIWSASIETGPDFANFNVKDSIDVGT
jgi:hypothetical protein